MHIPTQIDRFRESVHHNVGSTGSGMLSSVPGVDEASPGMSRCAFVGVASPVEIVERKFVCREAGSGKALAKKDSLSD